jgi:hypothetical protein
VRTAGAIDCPLSDLGKDNLDAHNAELRAARSSLILLVLVASVLTIHLYCDQRGCLDAVGQIRLSVFIGGLVWRSFEFLSE